MKHIHEKKIVFLLYLTIVLTGFTLPEVLAGAGDSITWEDPVLFNSPVAHPSGPRFGDFNNDGYTDLYFRHYDEGKMTCYLNNGDGTFQYTGTYTMEVCPHGSVVSDVNNDGNPDLIFANSDAGLTHGGPYEGISVFFGNGDGTFQPYQFYDPYGSFTYSVDAGDINNDGYKDLVIASAGWDGFSILLNDGDGSFSEGNHYAGAREASVINLGDFNGDGELDVALSCGGYGQGYEVGIYMGNGDGTFQNRVSYASPVSQGKPYCKGVFDLDNQNGPDLVFSISYNFYIMRNDGSGAFSFELVAQNFYPTSVCDRDNDGNVDVFAREWSETAEDYTGEYIFTNDGTGIFTPVDLSIDIDATETYAGNFGVNDAMGIGFSDQTSGSCGVYLQSGLPALNADFTADNTNVILGTEINFTDLSTGFPVLWEWDFENDGMIDSYEQNPSRTYSEPGVYTVMLRIYDVDGTEIDEEIKEDYITVEENSSPGFYAYYPFNGNAEDFSGNGFHGIVHGPVLTEDRFGNPNSAYLFDNNYIETPFNWGENITGESAFHIVFWFKANETANMYAIGESGQSQATFSTLSTSNGGSVGVKIKGGTWNGYGANPYDGNWHMVTMGTDGSNIRWSVDTWISGGNDWGSNLGEYFLIGMEGCYPDLKFRGVIDEVKIYNYILSTDQVIELYNEINTNLLADFEADITEGNMPLNVQFTDLSSGNPSTWEWDFENDGIIDAHEQNPLWVYNEPGVYSVTLSVSDSLGSTDSITKENYITVLEPNYFSNEYVDLNDNQAPEGWELEVLNPVVDITNGRLNAYATDASGALVRNGAMHDSVDILQLEMDSELKYSYWGISPSFLINFSDTSVLAAFTNYSNYTPNNDRIRTKIYYEKNGSMTVLYDSYYTTLFTEFHYIFKISDEQIIYKAIDKNSDSAYININITSDSLQNYITLKEITQIRFNAYTTTDNDIWIDNLQIQLNPVNQNQATAQFVVNPGWNLLSVPLQMPDMSALNLFPEAVSSIYGFESNYIIADTLNNGAGYWARFDSSVTKSFAGLTPTDNIPLSSGWNMIGAYNDTISVSSIITDPANIIVSDIYHFEGAYSLATDLLPGKGYWIKAAQDGEILISPGNMAKAVVKNINKSDWATIKITDAAGCSGKLFIADNLDGSYELPPLPPAGIFDIRFSGDKYVENLASGREIILRDAEYPVKIQVIGKDIILKNSGGTFNISIIDGETITIEDNSINRLLIEENFVPLSYELMQNYPNPFNPSTTIRFTIPEECNVVLNIYNTLGQKVCVLLNEKMKPGYHEVQFDGSALASGLYFYSIKAGDFSSVKKMLLLK